MKVVVVTFPDGYTTECHYWPNLTDEENVAEWEQGWGHGSEKIKVAARVQEVADAA